MSTANNDLPERLVIGTGISKVYQNGSEGLLALQSVSFAVHSGEMLCIVGPSGCGKSTLLMILAGLLKPSAGDLWIAPTVTEVAFVPQTPSLLPWRTLLQNACLGLEIKAPLNKARLRSVQDAIEEYGLRGFEGQLPSELSGGMAQRVSVIRALESGPQLLLCDEPFSAIDFVTRLELNTRFKRMCSVNRITTIFVTHNIEEAIFLGNEIAVMSGRPGTIVARYRPHLSIGAGDAVQARKSPEFTDLFVKIWNQLKGVHDEPE